MGGYIPGDYTTETEEERRRRLAAEQAQYQAQDQESGGITAQRPSLGDLASQYLGRRVDAAQQRVTDAGQVFTDPAVAMERRLGVAQQPDAANTEVQSQQVKTYADGSQEEIVKRQMPAPTPEPAPVAPTAMPPAPQVATSPAPAPAAAPAPQAQTQQAQPTAVVPTAPAVPEGLVAGGGVPERPDIGQVPTPGPAVQVAQAGPVNPAVAPAPVVQQAPAAAPGASLAQAGQVAQATTRPQWAVDLEAAGTDQDKLIDIAANKAYPQDVREDAKAKLRQAQDKDIAAKDAEKTVMAAAQGDPKAQQKLLNSIKPGAVKREEEGRVTEGSYIRAYLYARLGLNDLAQDEQQKILGKSKFGQVTVNGQSFEVETDPRSGRVLLARDAEGNKVDTPILNKIRAEAAKFGTHAYGFTGGSLTIPPSDKENSGQEYRQRTNSITGQIENVITTGPNAGKLYTGAPGYEKRVETNAAVKLNDAYIDFQTKPTIAMATTMLELAGKADNGKNNAIANAMAEIQRRSPAIFNQIKPLASSITAQGGAAGGTTTQGGGTATQGGGTTTQGGGGGGSLLQQTTSQVESIKTAEELKRAELKPPAEARGKNEAKDINNQRYSNETYGLIKPISDAIKQSTGSGLGTKVDQLAGVFGVGTTGAQAKASLDVLGYNLVSNVPRFEGAQSDRDVALYERAAGDIANTDKPINVRLAALNTIVQMLKKYDKAGANDWSFGTAKPSEIKIISREKVQ
jgi:hypothetical protein